MFTKWKVYQLLVQDKYAKEMLSLGQGPCLPGWLRNLFHKQLDVDGGRPGNKVIDLPS